MARLSKKALAELPAEITTPAYNTDDLRTGIVHLGPGAFHRAHQAVYTQHVDEQGQWGICAVSLRRADLKNALHPQDNLYTLMILDEAPQVSIIGALKEVLVLDDDRSQVMSRLTSPQTHIVTLTITEKGYCLNNDGQLDLHNADILHDINNPDTPVSAVGLLAGALKLRMQNNTSELTIVSCDNLPDNGDKLRAAVLQFVRRTDTSLSKWVEDNVCFPNTMVDSITPASDDALLNLASKITGCEDAWPIQREAFSQWVIEDKFSGPRPPWEKAGVIITDNVHLFEKAKLRVLNGSHSALAYIGSLCEFKTVYEAISDKAMRRFIRQLIKEEILATLTVSESLNPETYAEEILKRFSNRHIQHLLSQIAWDGSQKLPPRILNTIRDNLAAKRSISRLSAVVAAWIVFVIRRVKTNDQLVDPMADCLQQIVQSHDGDIAATANSFLNDERIFGDLSQSEMFCQAVSKQLATVSSLSKSNSGEQLITLCR